MDTKRERLERIVERNAEWRESDRRKAEREQELAERYRLTATSPVERRTDFWCRRCKLDFNALGTKALCGEGRSRYDAKCPLCHGKISRRITETAGDPFFQESESIRKARLKAGDDLLQPSDPRWDKVYGKRIRDRASYDQEGKERVEWERGRKRT